MNETLKDPKKAAHEIVEVLEDGDAIRNDGVRLTAANKNPWYVLATIYGEHGESADGGGSDPELSDKNRRIWNRWFLAPGDQRHEGEIVEKYGLSSDDIRRLTPTEKEKIKNIFLKRTGGEMAIPTSLDGVDFTRCYFSRYCDFEGYVFQNRADFTHSVFNAEVNFRGSHFDGHSSFRKVAFNDFADFGLAKFQGPAKFSKVSCKDDLFFGAAEFLSVAEFSDCEFRKGAIFIRTRFQGNTFFRSSKFYGESIYSSAAFKSITRFTNARFLTHVPEFHAAELYDDTVFTLPDNYRKNWPPLKSKDVMPAAEQKRAYNRLRLFMNKSLQLDEEQFFHRMEMRCKTKLARWYHKPLFWLYGGVSDFGNSVVRPIVGIIAVIAFGTLFMLWWQGLFNFTPQEAAGIDWTFGLIGEDGDIWEAVRNASGWSLANTMPFLGFGKLYYGGEFATNLDWPLRVVGGLQTVLGYVLLFFVGLGLRNRFRLR